jgi:hypothetical protein
VTRPQGVTNFSKREVADGGNMRESFEFFEINEWAKKK